MLNYEPEQPREIEPLMGWTSSGDMRQQVRLCVRHPGGGGRLLRAHGIAYQVFETKPVARRVMSYSDNFSFKRSEPWTH